MSLAALLEALVGLEETIDPNLRVSRWRPAGIEPPHLYNWINPSPADIPAVDIVRDQVNLAVRIIVKPADIDDETASIEAYWDLARDVIDGDLVRPAESVLSPAAHMARRTTMRNISDRFNDIQYLGLELVIQAELRRRFT
jgi:hypothetical protein